MALVMLLFFEDIVVLPLGPVEVAFHELHFLVSGIELDFDINLVGILVGVELHAGVVLLEELGQLRLGGYLLLLEYDGDLGVLLTSHLRI